MNTSVSNQIIQVLEALCDKFGLAVDWSSQNIAPYLQNLVNQAVQYNLWTNVLYLGVTFLIMLVCWIIVWRLSKKAGFDINYAFYNGRGAETFAGVLGAMGTISAIAFVILCFVAGHDIVTCITFPEKVVIDMLQDMMAS